MANDQTSCWTVVVSKPGCLEASYGSSAGCQTRMRPHAFQKASLQQVLRALPTNPEWVGMSNAQAVRHEFRRINFSFAERLMEMGIIESYSLKG